MQFILIPFIMFAVRATDAMIMNGRILNICAVHFF